MTLSIQEQMERMKVLVSEGDTEAKKELRVLQKRAGELPSVQSMYPDCVDEYSDVFMPPYDYSPILDSFGERVIETSYGSYQGDTKVLIKDSSMFGYVSFGWGSCSGCDALQGCDSYDDVQNLIDEFWSKILWFSSKETAIAFFKDHDWEGDYSYHEDDEENFVKQCIEYLESQP